MNPNSSDQSLKRLSTHPGTVLPGGVPAERLPATDVISVSHGDAELVLGWWGWYGGTPYVAQALEAAADQAIADPENNKYTFEYDGVTFEFYDKFYPTVTAKIRKAAALGAWEVVGGTYAEQLPYQVGLESNIRQWVIGTRTIREIVGQAVKTFHYQEFMLFPQLPMILSNVGIEQTVYENHLAICGRVHKDFRGAKWWIAADGSKVLAISDSPGLFVDWPDLLHIKSSKTTLGPYLRQVGAIPAGSFSADESEFYFDAADFTDSYGNLASIKNCLTETHLLSAERFATLASVLGGTDYSEQMTAAWKALLGTQTHGVMYCGSEAYCSEVGASTYEAARYLRRVAVELASDVLSRSLAFIAATADTRSDRSGKALVVFNPQAQRRTCPVEAKVSFREGEAHGLRLWQGNNDIAAHVDVLEKHADGSLKQATVFFMAETLPSFGYRTYHVEDLPTQLDTLVNSGLLIDSEAGTVENQFIRVQFDPNGSIAAIYGKGQGAVLLGASEHVEPLTAYDKTAAIRFRSTLQREDWYAPRGWEVVEATPLKVVVRSKFESNLSYGAIVLTLYDGLERLDIRAELTAKGADGDVLRDSGNEAKERLWLDFIPAFKGQVKCDTVGDVLYEARDYYFSNTWLNYAGSRQGFTLAHKGIHAWNEGYSSQENREKKERALSAQLGQTETSWIAGMLRLNTKFSDDGVIRQEFALFPIATTDECEIHQAVQGFYFDALALVTEQHPGDRAETEFVHLQSDNALLTAFYGDISTGKMPALRLWNPTREAVRVDFVAGFDFEAVQDIRLDGTERGEPYRPAGGIDVPARGLRTLKFVHRRGSQSRPRETGVTSSSVPFERRGDDYYFDAPLESYRLYTQLAEFQDEHARVYMFTDPYEEIDLRLVEGPKEGDYRIWTGSVELPKEVDGRRVRLVLSWPTDKRYGIGTCLLTNDYSQRADEPITVVVNGQAVPTYDYDLTRYIRGGETNHIRVNVLAPLVPQSELSKRSSIMQYSILESAGVFGTLGSARLRIGKMVNASNCQAQADCCIVNPGFESGDLSGWVSTGEVVVTDGEAGTGTACHARIIGKGLLEQAIGLRPGHYILRAKVKTVGGDGGIGVKGRGLREMSATVSDTGRWETLSVPFTVPDGTDQVVIYGQAFGDAGILVDDFKVVANKVAQAFSAED